LLPNFCRRVDDCRASPEVSSIGKAAAGAGVFLDENFVITGNESGHARGRHGDAVLFGLDFFGDADDHGVKVLEGLWTVNVLGVTSGEKSTTRPLHLCAIHSDLVAAGPRWGLWIKIVFPIRG